MMNMIALSLKHSSSSIRAAQTTIQAKPLRTAPGSMFTIHPTESLKREPHNLLTTPLEFPGSVVLLSDNPMYASKPILPK